MRILMLGNSFTSANDMPATLAGLTGAEVVHHTRVGACLAEHLDPDSELGEKTHAALDEEFLRNIWIRTQSWVKRHRSH